MKKFLKIILIIGFLVCIFGLGINIYKMIQSQNKINPQSQDKTVATKSSFPVIEIKEDNEDKIPEEPTRSDQGQTEIKASTNTPTHTKQAQPATSTPVQSSVTQPQQSTQNIFPVVFHNGSGPMCIEATNYFHTNNISYSQYLTTDPEFSAKLEQYKQRYGSTSSGISANYAYLPIIFVGSTAYSGFNSDIGQQILSITYN